MAPRGVEYCAVPGNHVGNSRFRGGRPAAHPVLRHIAAPHLWYPGSRFPVSQESSRQYPSTRRKVYPCPCLRTAEGISSFFISSHPRATASLNDHAKCATRSQEKSLPPLAQSECLSSFLPGKQKTVNLTIGAGVSSDDVPTRSDTVCIREATSRKVDRDALIIAHQNTVLTSIGTSGPPYEVASRVHAAKKRESSTWAIN